MSITRSAYEEAYLKLAQRISEGSKNSGFVPRCGRKQTLHEPSTQEKGYLWCESNETDEGAHYSLVGLRLVKS